MLSSIKKAHTGADGRLLLLLASFFCALIVSVLLAFLPTGSSAGAARRLGGEGTTPPFVFESRRTSLFAREGARVAGILAVPPLLAGVPLLSPTKVRRHVSALCAFFLGLLLLISAASIGLFYLPAMALLIASQIKQG